MIISLLLSVDRGPGFTKGRTLLCNSILHALRKLPGRLAKHKRTWGKNKSACVHGLHRVNSVTPVTVQVEMVSTTNAALYQHSHGLL